MKDKVWMVALGNFSHDKANKKGFSKGFEVGLLEGSCNWKNFMAAVREVSSNVWFTYDIAVEPDFNKRTYLKEEQLLEALSQMDEVLER